MKLVYVAGPFTGPTAWDIEQNIRAAECLALEVARLGAMPLCPHTNTRYFHGQCTPEFWYEGTIEMMRRCDAVVMVSGWAMSKGARDEHAEAVSRGMPVFVASDLSELARWLEDEKVRDGRR